MFVLLEGPLEENSLMELWLGEVALEVQVCPVGIPIIFLCILIFFVVWETYKNFVVAEMFVNVTWYVQVATTISI